LATATKRCVNCKERDRNENMKQTPNKQWFCDNECIAKYANKRFQNNKQKQVNKVIRECKRKVKATNKKHAERKRAFKDNDKSLRMKAAQSSFNAFIRKRDEGLNCISCGKAPNSGEYIGGSGIHAGHFKSCGAHSELRFNELNCHVQCFRCNVHLSGNIKDYRPALIEKIGLDKVEWIEGPHEPKKYTCEQLKQIELTYKQKLLNFIAT